MTTYPSGPLGVRRETKADLCRAALKAAGYSARRVTVKSGSYYREVKLTIRDASVRLADIEAIIGPLCPSQEIYGDGQPFASPTHEIAYLPEIVKPIADSIEAEFDAAEDGATVDTGIGFASWHRHGPERKVFVRGSFYCVGVRHAAERLAVEILSRGPADAWLDRLDLDDAEPTRPALAIVR